LLGAGQDGSRQWITLVAAICQDCTYLPPLLIYAGKLGNVQDTWLDDFDPDTQEAYFSASLNGWTTDKLGYHWLTTIFDRHTRKKARKGHEYRLLIIDGHGSHINIRFLNWCEENRVLVAVFLPHSTYRLQPLDVALFSPLATYYSQ
jgi:DDE superfamily endonuclease